MSLRYKGGRISATAATTSASSAVGLWTLKQQMQAIAGSGWPAPYNGPPSVDFLVVAGGGGGGGGDPVISWKALRLYILNILQRMFLCS